MGLRLAAFPTLPQHTQTVTLDGGQFQVELTWRRRCQGWYLSLYTLDGTPLALGRRLSPGWPPLLGLVLETGPDGIFLVRGADGYTREDLGASLALLYYPRAELAAAVPAVVDDGIAIEIA